MTTLAVAAVREAAAVVPAGARVVLAVSGGRDSVGMACLVTAARPDLDATIVHVRHGLRDDAADAAAAQACGAALALPVQVVPVTVTDDGTGPESAARSARLAALATAAREAGAAFVLTGHTADDQAETMLLNLARGAGLAGLAGIPPQRELAPGIALLRPLLGLRREAVRSAAAEAGLPVVDDPTNADRRQRRAVARHDLLPLLQELTGGGSDPVAALARLAGHARTEVAALDTIAAQVAERLIARWAHVLAAPAPDLDALPAAVAVRVLREMVARAGGPDPLPESNLSDLHHLPDGAELTLPAGVRASRGGGWFAVAAAAPALARREVAPGLTALPEIGLALRCDSTPPAGAVLPPWAPARATPTIGVAAPDGLLVRPRQPGDTVATAAGTQSVADAMIDAGVPRVARDRLPVVADAAGVLWVPGVAVRAGTDGPWTVGFEVPAGE